MCVWVLRLQRQLQGFRGNIAGCEGMVDARNHVRNKDESAVDRTKHTLQGSQPVRASTSNTTSMILSQYISQRDTKEEEKKTYLGGIAEGMVDMDGEDARASAQKVRQVVWQPSDDQTHLLGTWMPSTSSTLASTSTTMAAHWGIKTAREWKGEEPRWAQYIYLFLTNSLPDSFVLFCPSRLHTSTASSRIVHPV